MASKAKKKGARGEMEVIQLLQPIVDQVFAMFDMDPPKLQRNLEQVRAGGSDLNGIPFLDVEIKRQEELRIEEWWKQACASAKPHTEPVLMWRTNRGGWNVMLYLTCQRTCNTMRSVVTLHDFARWFRSRLTSYLMAYTIEQGNAP